ncbi:MAG: DUF1849 family protein [Bdellovibrionales bacterium]
MRILISIFAIFIILCHYTSEASEIKLPGQDIGFQPHKALYEVQLQSAKSGSQIVNIKGNMYYEWDYGCRAWSSKHRFNILYDYADSPAIRISSDFSNRENYEGNTLNFNVVRRQDGKQYEEIRGHASTPPNSKGEAIYNQPAGLVQELPEGTMFPLAHTIDVIKAAIDGQKFHNAVIYDGSDDEGPVEINTFIGKAVETPSILKEAQNSKALNESLLSGEARRVQLAFFPLKSTQDQSDYEMNVILHDNSVISEMIIDYHDFTVSQRLIAIEPIDVSESIKACQ